MIEAAALMKRTVALQPETWLPSMAELNARGDNVRGKVGLPGQTRVCYQSVLKDRLKERGRSPGIASSVDRSNPPVALEWSKPIADRLEAARS